MVQDGGWWKIRQMPLYDPVTYITKHHLEGTHIGKCLQIHYFSSITKSLKLLEVTRLILHGHMTWRHLSQLHRIIFKNRLALRVIEIRPVFTWQEVRRIDYKGPWERSLGGSAVECLPLAQGVILETQDRVPHRAPYGEPASPSACISASLSGLSWINK